MKEVSRDFAHKTSPWRKAIAVITATALVASMSNIQAFGDPGEEEAPAIKETVTVRFEIDPGVTVSFDEKYTFTNESESTSIEVKPGRNYNIRVNAATVDGTAYVVGGVEYKLGEKVANDEEESQVPGDSIEGDLKDEDKEDSFENSSVSGEDPKDSEKGADEEIVDITPVDPGVAEEPDSDDLAPSYSTPAEEDAVSGEESIAEEVTPMAPAPQSEEQESEDAAVEAEAYTSLVLDRDSVVLSKEILQEALEAQREILIKITAQSIGKQQNVSLWESSDGDYGLKDLLESSGDIKVVLQEDIVAEGSVTLGEGSKVIELAGHMISVSSKLGENGEFIIVPEGAKLEISDTESRGILPQAVGFENTTGNEGFVLDSGIALDGSEGYADNKLVYRISQSIKNRQEGTTREIRDTYELDLSKVGAVVSENGNASSLISVKDGGVFTLTGGRLTNEGGEHAVLGKGAVALNIAGGYIVGSRTTASGAGIYLDGENKSKENCSLVVSGNAVVGGNVTTEKSNSCGGGLYLNRCNALIRDDALIVANKAFDGEAYKTPVTATGLRPQISNGGGIYTSRNVDLVLEGSAVVASNRAARDGGGIYIDATEGQLPSNSLVLRDYVNISNNEASHNMEDVNPRVEGDAHLTDDSKLEERNWNVYPCGGGGIYSMGTLTIEDAQIVNNCSMDAGGGIMHPQNGGTILPEKVSVAASDMYISSVVVAGNYAHASEGGGIWCQPKATLKKDDQGYTNAASGSSYLKAGYITNNKTNTAFDYGGGGLYVNMEGYLEVYSPVVTKNTARGFGGGVGGCHNGLLVSSKAAVFDNIANQSNFTTNKKEYGDRWAYKEMYLGKLAEGASNDFFSAKKSTVQEEMLGGGHANWTGYTSGREIFQAVCTYDGWDHRGNASLVLLNSKNKKVTHSSTGKTVNYDGYSAGVEVAPGDSAENRYAYFYLPDSRVTAFKVAKDGLKGSVFTGTGAGFNGKVSSTNYEKSQKGIIEEVIIPDEKEKLDDGKNYRKIKLIIDWDEKRLPKSVDGSGDNVYADGGAIYNAEGKDVSDNLEFYRSFKSILPNLGDYVNKMYYYNIYKINEFPSYGKVEATRFLALKANPSDEDKKSAMSEGLVFISGNYSNTNGGGVACNGFIGLGTKDDTSEPEEDLSLTVEKLWEGFDSSDADKNGMFSAIFRVRIYDSKGACSQGLVNTETVRTLLFGQDEPQSFTVDGIPSGSYVTVEELSYDGSNMTSRLIGKGTLDENGGALMRKDLAVTFENTYKDEGAYSTSVVNSYATGMDEDDNSFVHVDQDSLYKKKHPEVEKPSKSEETESSPEETPAEAAN